jgi:hypothetical protein
MLGHSLFYSRLVILTSLPSEPDSLLSSEIPISIPGVKIIFCVFGASALDFQLQTGVTVR